MGGESRPQWLFKLEESDLIRISIESNFQIVIKKS